MRGGRVVAVALVVAVLATGCGKDAATTTKATTTKAPADSATPAAGACLPAEGGIVTVSLPPDVPVPRCVQVTASQRLRVVSRVDTAVTVHLGNEEVRVDPRESATIDRQFGEYLQDGVHRMRVDGYVPGGAEIWLRPASALEPTSAPPTTTTPRRCSAAGLSPDLPADPGLPAPVAAMRADLARAAVECDYDALAVLADRNGKAVRFSFGAETDPVTYWRTGEERAERPGPLRALRLLLALPHTEQHLGNGDVVYAWPRAYAAEHPTEAQLREIADTGLYDLATLRGWLTTGNNYLGYRILVTSAGDWRAFVAGD